jgi:hypothetical protein
VTYLHFPLENSAESQKSMDEEATLAGEELEEGDLEESYSSNTDMDIDEF